MGALAWLLSLMRGLPWLGILALAFAATLASLLVINRFNLVSRQRIQALEDGLRSLLDRDYSLGIANSDRDSLSGVIAAYSRLNETLRDERIESLQRELLLNNVIQAASVALVLTNAKGVITYSNTTARSLLIEDSTRLEGRSLLPLCRALSESLATVTASGSDGLFEMLIDGQREIFHLTRRKFTLNNQVNYLYLYKQLTREFTQKEVDTWKKVIRVISHELNNSLAPIKSLCHSGLRLAESSEKSERLADVFNTIRNRTLHLHNFIDQYADFARLPKPKLTTVDWQEFIGNIRGICEFNLIGSLPGEPGTFDEIQIEQVVINLLKNARESGSREEDIQLQVEQDKEYSWVRIEDSGPGMNAGQIQQALLPFFSTKRNGTGLGLPLCREIIEGHGGRLRLIDKESGGLIAVLRLPRS